MRISPAGLYEMFLETLKIFFGGYQRNAPLQLFCVPEKYVSLFFPAPMSRGPDKIKSVPEPNFFRRFFWEKQTKK